MSPLSVALGEDAYHRFYFEIFHVLEPIQTQVRVSIVLGHKFVQNLHFNSHGNDYREMFT